MSLLRPLVIPLAVPQNHAAGECSRVLGGDGAALLLQHGDELLEADISVVRAGGSLRVVLDAHCLLRAAQHAGARAIVQVDVRDLDVRRQLVRVHRVVVVLCADLNASCTALTPYLQPSLAMTWPNKPPDIGHPLSKSPEAKT